MLTLVENLLKVFLKEKTKIKLILTVHHTSFMSEQWTWRLVLLSLLGPTVPAYTMDSSMLRKDHWRTCLLFLWTRESSIGSVPWRINLQGVQTWPVRTAGNCLLQLQRFYPQCNRSRNKSPSKYRSRRNSWTIHATTLSPCLIAKTNTDCKERKWTNWLNNAFFSLLQWIHHHPAMIDIVIRHPLAVEFVERRSQSSSQADFLV